MLELWEYIVIFGLNYEYCGRLDTAHWTHTVLPSVAQSQALKNIKSAVSYFVENGPKLVNLPDYSSLVNSKRMDYNGDEAGHALPICLAELMPGLPPKDLAASVDATSLCSAHLKAWLENPMDHLLPVESWPLEVPKARVQVGSNDEYYKIVRYLLDIGVLTTIPFEDIFEVNGQKVLNGMFAVPKKGEVPEGVDKITRLIMNLVPGNAYQKLLTESLGTLHSAASWTNISIPSGHVLLWSSDDIKGAFYIFRLPKAWRPFMAFEKPIPGAELGPGWESVESVYLCSAVIPMGWINAVPLFQHIMRRLALCDEPIGAGLPSDLEWRRDAPLPLFSSSQAQAWVQTYLDDFDAPQIVPREAQSGLESKPSPALVLKRLANARNGISISENKAVLGALRTERMGAWVDGDIGRVGVSSERLYHIAGFGFFILSKPIVNCKALAMYLGRLVHAFEFRRPLMSCLNDVWKYEYWTSNTMLTMDTITEILISLSLLPLAYSDLRADVSPQVTCSDASMSGGGLCVSRGLTDTGLDVLTQCQTTPLDVIHFKPQHIHRGALSCQVARVICVGLFDGLGGLRIALQKLHLHLVVVVYISSETDKSAKRLVRKRWPGVQEWGSVESINREMITKIADVFKHIVDLVIIGAGSPCQDLSFLNKARVGLNGKKSRLFYRVPKIVADFRAEFGKAVHYFVENVFSMEKSQVVKFNSVLGTKPYLIDGGDFTDCTRKRFYWCSWDINPSSAVELTENDLYITVKVHVDKPKAGSWISDDYVWVGPHLVPTLTRALPSSKPMRSPAGIDTASMEAKQRWVDDDHCFQVYCYEAENMLVHPVTGALRLPTAEEAELLMGIDKYYTVGASKDGIDTRASFVLRRQLIGNSFNCCVVSFIVSQLLEQSKLVLEPIPLKTHLTTGISERPLTQFELDSQTCIDDVEINVRLVKEYLRIAERGGSDVRLELGIPFRPDAWPRAGARTQFWAWRIVHGYPWKNSKDTHINKLELLAAFSSLKWRARKTGNQNSKFLHMVDSQVVGAILTKGRTSSQLLRPTIRRISALVLAAQFYPAYIFVASEDNPADIPSRYSWVSKKPTRMQKGLSEKPCVLAKL